MPTKGYATRGYIKKEGKFTKIQWILQEVISEPLSTFRGSKAVGHLDSTYF